MALASVPEPVGSPVRVIVVEPDPALQDDLCAAVASSMAVAVVVDAVAGLAGALEDGGPTVAVVGPGLAVPFGLEQLHRLVRAFPDLAPVLVVPEVSTEFLQHALRSGARDVVTMDAPVAALADAVARVRADLLARAPLPARSVSRPVGDATGGRMIAVFGAKGGVGTTTVAVNLAAARARTDEPVVLVDADRRGGDVALLLGVAPARTVDDLVGSVHYAEPDLLRSLLVPAGDDLLVLPAPPAAGDLVDPDELLAVAGALRSVGTVVVDVPAGDVVGAAAILEAADDILLVTSMDVPAVKRLTVGLSEVHLVPATDPRCRLVANRVDARGGLATREVERVLGVPVVATVPEDVAVTRAVNAGVPVVRATPRTPAARALLRLAATLDPGPSRSRRTRRRG
jgi:pilus assembly protein CpaE